MGCGVQTKRHCVGVSRCPLVEVVVVAVAFAAAAVRRLPEAKARVDTRARPAPEAAEGREEGSVLRPVLVGVLLVGSGVR